MGAPSCHVGDDTAFAVVPDEACAAAFVREADYPRSRVRVRDEQLRAFTYAPLILDRGLSMPTVGREAVQVMAPNPARLPGQGVPEQHHISLPWSVPAQGSRRASWSKRPDQSGGDQIAGGTP